MLCCARRDVLFWRPPIRFRLFLCRIYREGNASGFVKGFTDEPESLLAGFGKLEKASPGGLQLSERDNASHEHSSSELCSSLHGLQALRLDAVAWWGARVTVSF